MKEKGPENYIEIHCYLESNKGRRFDEYEIHIMIGKSEFGIADGWTGKRSVMAAARKLAEATGFRIVELKSNE